MRTALGYSKIRLSLSLAFLLSPGVASIEPGSRLMAAQTASPQSSQQATLEPVVATAADIPFKNGESGVEEQMLELANQSRREAGMLPLVLDAGLSQAARTHARAMLEAHELSHQFAGELSLPQRLGAATSLQLAQEGENVALDYDAEHGHEHLMLSPPHRANLLNPAYNVIGLGVVRNGDRLYIVQDFGQALPSYSSTEMKDRIEAAVNHVRSQARRPTLERRDLLIADDAACSMAQADKLGSDRVLKLTERFTVMTYTSLHPETLPSGAVQVLSSRNLQTFSIGACYARTQMYPTGVYWVVLSLE